MKLYTEEQVKQMLDMYVDYVMFYTTADEILNEHTPIEPPTDEEIENDAKEFVLSHDFSALTNPNHLANRCFQLGAKWMRDKIKGGSNE